MKRLTFHIDHSSHPEYLTEIIELMEKGILIDDLFGIGKNQERFSAINTERSFGNVLSNLKRLRIIDDSESRWSDFGRILISHLHEFKIVSNLLHYRLFSLWNPADCQRNCFSWSYRTICGILLDLDGQLINIKDLSSKLQEVIELEFAEKFGVNPSDISVSQRTIQGGLKWVELIEPPVLDKNDKNIIFQRRDSCPPWLILLGLDLIYRDQGIPYGSNIIFSQEIIDFLYSLTLLSNEAFKWVYQWMKTQYPDFIQEQEGGGWATQICLLREPKLQEVIY
ncbi:MAG: hypothetical protein K8T10_16005 [Candidatus Eremiobacteraeota bacterium]|nr:hypothetical protein [Candidatus Eremiobacteraeota bacterium]